MKTLTNLFIVASIIATLGGCLSGTAHASDYEEIGREAATRFINCKVAFMAVFDHFPTAHNICEDIIARDLSLKYRGAKMNNRFMARDGEIE